MGLFIAIEGLDGSGKTTAARRAVDLLNAARPGSALFSYEPNDDRCGGPFIRQALRKEIAVSPRTLALAYAANRADHGDRTIGPFLEGGEGRVLICDRYVLSSLVYNSSPNFGFEKVMELNAAARRPDLIMFIDADVAVCRERMKKRGGPSELFDDKLAQLRLRYAKAIVFLEETGGPRVVRIDGNGSIEQTATAILNEIQKFNF